MKLYGFLEPAQIEFDEAVSFYNHQREYLGDEFAAEVLNKTWPRIWLRIAPQCLKFAALVNSGITEKNFTQL
ncbi:MAG: hypothetical protein ACXWZQ_20695 [Candidatus Binatia bacterium]